MARMNLKNARQRLGMTQQQMADELGICSRHYKKIESGDTLGSIKIWDALEDITEIGQRFLREIHPDTADNQ